MIGIEPCKRGRVQELWQDQTAVNRRKAERFPFQHLAMGITAGQGGGLAHYQQVFDANAKRAFAVVTRFI